MASRSPGSLTSRIPVTPETLARLREFAAGMDATYDETINALIDMAQLEMSKSVRYAGVWLKGKRGDKR